MFKLLRKYNKGILVVGGVLLMVVFLIPQAIQGLGQYSAAAGAPWATVDGVTIKRVETTEIAQEVALIELMGQRQILALIGQSEDEDAHWFLLRREAEQAGLVGGEGDGRTLLTQLAAQGGADERVLLQNLMGGARMRETGALYRALSRINGASRLISVTASAPRWSDVRLREQAIRLTTGVDADIVILDARELDSLEVAAPTEEELAAQLAEFGEALPGDPESRFGYRLPDRAQVEWIRISKDAVRASLENSDELDPITLRKAFLRDPADFGISPFESARPDFEQYREVVRDKVLRDLEQERLDEIAKFSSDQLALGQRSLDRRGSLLVLPENWSEERLALAELADEIQREFGVELPAYTAPGEWLSGPDIQRLEEIGLATTTKFGTNPIGLSQLLAAADAFNEETALPIQIGVGLPALRDADGNIYIARFTAADPSRAPASVDEAREELVRDVTGLKRFEMLEQMIEDLRATVIADGLDAVATELGAERTTALALTEADPTLLGFGFLSRKSLPGGVRAPAIVTELTTAGRSLDPTVPATEQPIEQRVVVAADEDALVVVAGVIQRVNPVTVEDWEGLASAGTIVNAIAPEDEATVDALATFGFEALAERHSFVLAPRQEEEFEEDAS